MSTAECAPDDINAKVWREAAGEHEGADILWTFDFAAVQGYAEGRAGGLRARAKDPMESGRNLLGQETSPYLLQHAA